MSIIHPGLFLLIERYPERGPDLSCLYAKSPGFQALCADYQRCSEAIRYWSNSEKENGPDRHSEYQALLKELEAEILQFRPDDPCYSL